jgi:hypothetical protein
MPIHDWTRVDAGIFHHFQQRWIVALTDVLNDRLLPADYYALTEQQGAGFEPDILTLKAGNAVQVIDDATETPAKSPPQRGGSEPAKGSAVVVAQPRVQVTAETDLEFYRRKQNVVAVRHVSGDRLVAVVAIVSKGNKSGRKAFDDFVRKVADLLAHQVHLLILDLQPSTRRDPQGIHGAIWDEVAGALYDRPPDKPLTLAAYESASFLRAHVQPVAVGDPLIPMPLFLEPGSYVEVPLEETYQASFASVPRRWRAALENG